MKRFIKYYALEIYTVLALSFIVAAAVIGNLSTVQKLVVVDALLFVLHEWEEVALSRWVHQTDFRPCRYKSG